MYRNFLNSSLSMNELKSQNKYAPKGLRYCNGFCQDYIDSEIFSGSKSNSKMIKMICNFCRNLIGLAKSQIKENKITLEQFKENPNIVHGYEEININTSNKCNTCKETKPVTLFRNNNTCNACVAIKKNTNKEDIIILISDIELLKQNFTKLKNFIELIPKDKLIMIISHYKIGRKSSDNKAKMVGNTVNYFKQLANPYICSGGCGYKLQEQFSICEGCAKKVERKKTRQPVDMVHFHDNIDSIVEELDVVKDQDYNKEQTFKIGRKLGIKIRQKDPKKDMVDAINVFLKKRDEERKNKEMDLLIIHPTQEPEPEKLELNGVLVSSREDGYVNATELCKAGGKQFKHWKENKQTKELVTELESEVGIPSSQLIDTKKGNSSTFKQGSWIHPDLAVHLAIWVSPKFAMQVSRWVREIVITGRVTAGEEKNNDKLLELQQALIKQKELTKKMENKHKRILHKRSYHKFKKGPAFYIISDVDGKSLKYKVGMDGADVNVRLQQHRSTMPETKLEYLIYTQDALTIETTMLKRYKLQRTPQLSHEWIYNTELERIKDGVKTIINFLDVDYTEDSDIQQYNEDIKSFGI